MKSWSTEFGLFIRICKKTSSLHQSEKRLIKINRLESPAFVCVCVCCRLSQRTLLLLSDSECAWAPSHTDYDLRGTRTRIPATVTTTFSSIAALFSRVKTLFFLFLTNLFANVNKKAVKHLGHLVQRWRKPQTASLWFLLGSKRQVWSSLNQLISVLHLPVQFPHWSLPTGTIFSGRSSGARRRVPLNLEMTKSEAVFQPECGD